MDIKVAAWNIYFSWNLVEKRNSRLRVTPSQRRRAENVARIINDMDADVLGIVECMNKQELTFYKNQFCPQYDGVLVKGSGSRYNLGLLYKKSKVDVRTIRINTENWKTRIGDDRRDVTYKFARKPLVIELTADGTGDSMLLSVVHAKSKRPSDGLTPEEKLKEAVRNRKRIVAEGIRLRELLQARIESGNHDRFMIIGDVNDGPDFDRYEKQIWQSGIEAHLGSVLDPDRLLRSFIDLSDGKGQASSSFGDVQLDHMIFTENLQRGRTSPRVVPNSGRVRSDLVNLNYDGKRRDSDHAPVEVVVRF